MGVMKRLHGMRAAGQPIPMPMRRAFGLVPPTPGSAPKAEADMDRMQIEFREMLNARINPNHNPGGVPW